MPVIGDGCKTQPKRTTPFIIAAFRAGFSQRVASAAAFAIRKVGAGFRVKLRSHIEGEQP